MGEGINDVPVEFCVWWGIKVDLDVVILGTLVFVLDQWRVGGGTNS